MGPPGAVEDDARRSRPASVTGPGKNGWTLESVRCDRTLTTSWAGSRRAAASAPMSSMNERVDRGVGPRCAWVGPCVAGAARAGGAQRRHHADDPLDPGLHDGRRRPRAARRGAASGRCRAAARARRRCRNRCGTGLDQLVLAAEGPEDGALGDAGRLRDLRGCVTAAPCSRSSGMVTSTSEARRSSG